MKGNRTAEWLHGRRKQYLVDAVVSGRITMPTAFLSALDPRPLDKRLADYDAQRSGLK